MKKILIIGGSASGMGVAAKLSRNIKDAQIIVFEKNDYISFGACGLPYFVGNHFNDKNRLIERTIDDFKDTNILIKNNATVTKINEAAKTIIVEIDNKFSEYDYDELVIATGAKPVEFDVKEKKLNNLFYLSSFNDGIILKQAISKAKNIAIIGSGFIGLELCENLAKLNKKIYMFEKNQRVMQNIFDIEITEKFESELINNNVNLIKNFKSINYEIKDNLIKNINVDEKIINVDIVVCAIGFAPNTSFIPKTINKLKNGAIIIDEYGRTSVKNIWSIGDCASIIDILTKENIYVPLATVARKFSKLVANNIVKLNEKISGSLKTSIIRVFEKSAIRSGLSEHEIINKKIEYKKILINDKDQTNYVANQKDISLLLYVDKKTNIIIGGQMCGYGKSILRFNAIIELIWNKIVIDDYQNQIDLPYAPPFSRPVDIISIALSKIIK